MLHSTALPVAPPPRALLPPATLPFHPEMTLPSAFASRQLQHHSRIGQQANACEVFGARGRDDGAARPFPPTVRNPPFQP
jgi:hypothetical protein